MPQLLMHNYQLNCGILSLPVHFLAILYLEKFNHNVLITLFIGISINTELD